jgi:outer membrane protein
MLPSINAVGTVTKQQSETVIASQNQTLGKITLSQPLFVGLRDFALLRQTKALRTASKFDRDAAIVQLFKDLANNVYTILSIERDIKNLRAEMNLYRKRIAELKEFRKIGRSRDTEVLTVQTALASLSASEKQLLGQAKAAREVFAVMSGLPAEAHLRAKLSDKLTLQGPLSSYLSRIEQRPEVLAAKLRSAAAGDSVSIARAGHWPSIALNGNYYLTHSGFATVPDWDVQLALTLPIFSGGVTQSNVRGAVAKHAQADDQWLLMRHAAEQEIRVGYATLIADEQQLHDLTQAGVLAKSNYEAISKEYRLGLVTNLDVLTAMTSYQEIVRSQDRQRHTMQLDSDKLAAATISHPDLSALLSNAQAQGAQL